jgi:hypothetical protein
VRAGSGREEEDWSKGRGGGGLGFPPETPYAGGDAGVSIYLVIYLSFIAFKKTLKWIQKRRYTEVYAHKYSRRVFDNNDTS